MKKGTKGRTTERGIERNGVGVGIRNSERPIAAWRLRHNYDIYGYYRHYLINATATYIYATYYRMQPPG